MKHFTFVDIVIVLTTIAGPTTFVLWLYASVNVLTLFKLQDEAGQVSLKKCSWKRKQWDDNSCFTASV